MELDSYDDLARQATATLKARAKSGDFSPVTLTFNGKQNRNTGGIEDRAIYIRIGGLQLNWSATGKATYNQDTKLWNVPFKVHFDIWDHWQWSRDEMNFVVGNSLDLLIKGGKWISFFWHVYVDEQDVVVVKCE